MVVATDLGFDMLVQPSAVAALTQALTAAGAEPVSTVAAEVVRIEHGRPRYGVDMSDENLPGEAGIVERAVSFTKGCYVGQEPVARMFHKGHPNRHLRVLLLSERAGARRPGHGRRQGGRSRHVDGRLPHARADRAGNPAPRGGARRRSDGRHCDGKGRLAPTLEKAVICLGANDGSSGGTAPAL